MCRNRSLDTQHILHAQKRKHFIANSDKNILVIIIQKLLQF